MRITADASTSDGFFFGVERRLGDAKPPPSPLEATCFTRAIAPATAAMITGARMVEGRREASISAELIEWLVIVSRGRGRDARGDAGTHRDADGTRVIEKTKGRKDDHERSWVGEET